ncbi:MAG: zeta toxin family protein [Candidatus Saccharimonadales bacterium]
MIKHEEQLAQEAVRWIRRNANKKVVIEQFASLERYQPTQHPLVFFTAGSPGAGKTEFIKGFRESIERSLKIKLAILDPDKVRELLPSYTGSNSYVFQRAISIAVDDLFRHVLKHKQSAFVDGTLSDYDRAKSNLEKAIDHYGQVTIFYVFQHPAIAWHFTQLREVVEGRNIKKNDFIEKFLGAKEVVDKLKAAFGDKLVLNIILKDYKDTKENKAVASAIEDVSRIEDHLDFSYTKSSLERILH